MNEKMKQIALRVRELREILDMTTAEVANLAGIREDLYCDYENGNIENLPTTVLFPIAKALNTTPAYLMGWENTMESNMDFLNELFRDTDAITHVKKLSFLSTQSRHSIYDMIDFLSEKEKGL